MNSLEQASNLFDLVYEGQEEKIVSNNVKNAKIVVKELADCINKAKSGTNKSDIERNLEDAIKKANLIISNLQAALEYSKEHSGGF
jgi:fructose-specific phosphotransferase system component IIB